MRREHGITNRQEQAGEQGYLLLGALVAVAIVLIFLSVAATYIARDLKREREVETARRADQYVRAIRRYYLKFGHYPGSIDQLEHTNNIRFLRKKYVDPLTGTTDWRLILVGKNKTQVKGFFGQPLAGIATTGLGALAGSQSRGMPGANAAGAPGATGGILGTGAAAAANAAGTGAAANPASGQAVAGAAGTTAGTTAGPGAGTTGTGAAAGTGTTAGGNTAASNSPFSSSSGMFMGVGTNATGSSILEVNEQTNYQDWEFLWDPRLEQLKGAAALNSGLGSVKASQLGQPASTANPATGTTPGATTTPGQNGTNATVPSGDANQDNSTPRPPNGVGVPNQPAPRPPNNIGTPNQP